MREKNKVESNGIQGGSEVQKAYWSVVSTQRRLGKNKKNDLMLVQGGQIYVLVVFNAREKSIVSTFSIKNMEVKNLE